MIRVVKLGGSLHPAPELPDWLAALSAAGGRAVLVPGGGPFADQVREAQARWRFHDRTAHRMALLAMEQYGLMLCGLEPGLIPAASREDMLAVLARGDTPVWLPSQLCLDNPEIPENWDVTSDSLAAWLAAHLDAEALALVKHAVPAGEWSAATLAREGLVDPAFPGFLAHRPMALRLFGRADAKGFAAWLAAPAEG